jgi:hypothetical protein
LYGRRGYKKKGGGGRVLIRRQYPLASKGEGKKAVTTKARNPGLILAENGFRALSKSLVFKLRMMYCFL